MFNIKCFLKGHKLKWNRNIFGDEIRGLGYKRTEFKCERCPHYEYIHDFVIPTHRSSLLEDVDPLVMGRPRDSTPWYVYLLMMVFTIIIASMLYMLGVKY